MEFAATLREVRLQHHWSQQHLADLLGTTKVTVSRWEQGQTRPSDYFRMRLGQVFGMGELEWGPHDPEPLLREEIDPGAKRTPPHEAISDPALPARCAVPIVGREQER